MPLWGGYAGQLSDQGELLQWLRPDPAATGSLDGRPQLLADEVLYDSRAPWPGQVQGTGKSLERRSPSSYGNDAASWRAAAPTPGKMIVADADFNADGALNALDVDLLCAAVLGRDPNVDLKFDLNGDEQVNESDYGYLIGDVLNTLPGDANLDGVFNSSDLVQVFQRGTYEAGVAGNSSWADGDWNCDGEFSSGDLVAAFQAGGYRVNAVRRVGSADAALLADHDQYFELLGNTQKTRRSARS